MAQGTVVEGTIQQLFEGHHMNYIECINVDYKSTRKESFYGMLLICNSVRLTWLALCRILNISLYFGPCNLLLRLCLCPFCFFFFQTFNLMSKGVGMCMLPLTSMLKWNALRVITNIMQNSMVCRSDAFKPLCMLIVFWKARETCLFCILV